MNEVMVLYKQLAFDRKDFETQLVSIQSVEDLFRFKTMCLCDTVYTHVRISLCTDIGEDNLSIQTVEKVVPSHRFGESVFNVVKNLLFNYKVSEFFK